MKQHTGNGGKEKAFTGQVSFLHIEFKRSSNQLYRHRLITPLSARLGTLNSVEVSVSPQKTFRFCNEHNRNSTSSSTQLDRNPS